MNIRSLAPFGAEVIGIDCAGPLIDHAALAQQNASARVAVFRGQCCDDEQFGRFLSGFGPHSGKPEVNVNVSQNAKLRDYG
jgi:hypothetical protein